VPGYYKLDGVRLSYKSMGYSYIICLTF